MNIIKLDLTAPPEVTVETEADILLFRAQLEVAAKRIKEVREAHDAAIIKYFKANGIREIAISDTAKMYIAPNDKDRWITERVYDLFSFPAHVREVLEANPGFRKKAIEAKVGEKIAKCEAGKEADNPDALIAVEKGDKIVVKELDKKFIKG